MQNNEELILRDLRLAHDELRGLLSRLINYGASACTLRDVIEAMGVLENTTQRPTGGMSALGAARMADYTPPGYVTTFSAEAIQQIKELLPSTLSTS